MNPDSFVWISTARTGVSYHHVAEGGRKTVCGRYIGSAVEVMRGYLQPLAEVVDRYGAKPCKTCGGSSVAPVVVPKRGDRWTS